MSNEDVTSLFGTYCRDSVKGMWQEAGERTQDTNLWHFKATLKLSEHFSKSSKDQEVMKHQSVMGLKRNIAENLHKERQFAKPQRQLLFEWTMNQVFKLIIL